MENRKQKETKDDDEKKMGKTTNERSSSEKREHSMINQVSLADKNLSGNPTPSQDIQKGNQSTYGSTGIAHSPSQSPPSKKTPSVEQLTEVNIAAANMAVAHEIALDGSFKLPEPSETPQADTPEAKMFKVVQETMRRVFWDSVKKDMESDPPVYDHIFVLIGEIKEILLSLLPNNRTTSFHTRINEGLDVELLRQQADHGSLEVHKLSSFVIDCMVNMCAPYRDDQVAQLRKIDDIVELFKEIYQVLNLLKRDMANFYISSYRPHIQQQHVEYERDKFAKVLSNLPDGLKHTEIWLNEVRKELQTEQQQTEPSPTQRDVPLSPLTLLKKSYLRLLDWDYKTKDFPETLCMDEVRFLTIQSEFKRLILISSVLLTSLSNFGSSLSSHVEFTNKLKDDLLVLVASDQSLDDNLADMLSGLVEHVWESVTKYIAGKSPALESCSAPSHKETLKLKIENLATLRDNQVYNILEKRGSSYLHSMAEHLAQKKSSSGPHQLPVPPGFQILQKEMLTLAVNYAKLVNLNQMVYGPFYVPVLKKVLGIQSKSSPNQKQQSTTEVKTDQESEEKSEADQASTTS